MSSSSKSLATTNIAWSIRADKWTFERFVGVTLAKSAEKSFSIVVRTRDLGLGFSNSKTSDQRARAGTAKFLRLNENLDLSVVRLRPKSKQGNVAEPTDRWAWPIVQVHVSQDYKMCVFSIRMDKISFRRWCNILFDGNGGRSYLKYRFGDSDPGRVATLIDFKEKTVRCVEVDHFVHHREK